MYTPKFHGINLNIGFTDAETGEPIDVNSLPATEAEAKATGSRHYYSGPCPFGHEAPRLTGRKNSCLLCNVEALIRVRSTNL